MAFFRPHGQVLSGTPLSDSSFYSPFLQLLFSFEEMIADVKMWFSGPASGAEQLSLLKFLVHFLATAYPLLPLRSRNRKLHSFEFMRASRVAA